MAINLSGQALDGILLSKIDAPIGTIRYTNLTAAQYSSQSLGVWLLMNGQSCNGTEYQTLTGNATVPDAVTNGTFLRQAKAGRNPGTYEDDAFQGHWHNVTIYGQDTGIAGGNTTTSPSLLTGQNRTPNSSVGNNVAANTTSNVISDGTNGAPRTANETRPKNHAVNFFIKVAHA
jgi:hypothetical protein